MNLLNKSSNLPKITPGHKLEKTIDCIRHLIVQLSVYSEQENSSQITIINSSLRELGRLFHEAAREAVSKEEQGILFERGNRYYDLANSY